MALKNRLTVKYNGKEFDRTHGLDWYDYCARQYDPASGRFTSMDPLCEKYYNISPYSYCAGNPIRYVDPDGRENSKNWKCRRAKSHFCYSSAVDK